MKNLYSLSSYQYELPEELIAQYPCTPRDHSRLMVVEKASGRIWEMRFCELADFLEKGDGFIFNNTKVFRSRLMGKRPSGGQAEIFLTQPLSDGTWEALVRPGKKLAQGAIVEFSPTFYAEIVEILPEGGRRVRLHSKTQTIDDDLQKYAQIPLPPYIQRQVDPNVDEDRYQTIYAVHSGSVAAPTAGLHFTTDLLQKFQQKGIQQNAITLHVGLGTFMPVKTDDIREHKMHIEPFFINEETAKALNSQEVGKRQICVGTTCCRALESASTLEGIILSGEYKTNIFIYPGYQFKYVKNILTNFHLPGSSLLMLVSAFAGYDLMMEAYKKAVKERYRFFSYGDAMLII